MQLSSDIQFQVVTVASTLAGLLVGGLIVLAVIVGRSWKVPARPHFKSERMPDLGLVAGLACAVAAVYQLAGEAWALLLLGVLLIVASAIADIRASRQ